VCKDPDNLMSAEQASPLAWSLPTPTIAISEMPTDESVFVQISHRDIRKPNCSDSDTVPLEGIRMCTSHRLHRGQVSDRMTNTLLLECGGDDGVVVLDDTDRTLRMIQLTMIAEDAWADGRRRWPNILEI
jgi:hypothetical protein